MTIIIHSDGGARGNPGPAGIGAALTDANGTVLAEVSRYIGETTNNQAEYQALCAGIERAQELGATAVHCYLDSQLVVRQLNREYKVKNQELAPWFIKIHNLAVQIGTVTFTHVPREQNKHADRLVNQAIDAALHR